MKTISKEQGIKQMAGGVLMCGILGISTIMTVTFSSCGSEEPTEQEKLDQQRAEVIALSDKDLFGHTETETRKEVYRIIDLDTVWTITAISSSPEIYKNGDEQQVGYDLNLRLASVKDTIELVVPMNPFVSDPYRVFWDELMYQSRFRLDFRDRYNANIVSDYLIPRLEHGSPRQKI